MLSWWRITFSERWSRHLLVPQCYAVAVFIHCWPMVQETGNTLPRFLKLSLMITCVFITSPIQWRQNRQIENISHLEKVFKTVQSVAHSETHIHRVWIWEYFHNAFCFQHHSFCLNRTNVTENVKSYQTNTHINNLWTHEFWCMSMMSFYFAENVPSWLIFYSFFFL
jgi:hypothetical protein